MDGSPQLLSNIQFSEAKKGYDRDQVDNFLRELSKKVAELQDMLRDAAQRAETAEAKVAEALKAKSLAESLAAKASADAEKARDEAAAAAGAPAPPVNEIEAASGVLALAQKTADAAVAEGETKAHSLVADGRARAAMMVVEAEQEIVRIRERASQQVDSLVAEKLADVEVEVARLEVERDQLKIDVDRLTEYIEEHRSRLREGVAELTELLNDDHGALRLAEKPELTAPASDGSAQPTESSPSGPSADAPIAEPEVEQAPATTPAPEPPASPAPEPASAPSDQLPATEGADPSDTPDRLDTSDTSDTSDTESTNDGVTELKPLPVKADPESEPTPDIPKPTIVTLEDLSTGPASEAPAADIPRSVIDLTREREKVAGGEGDATQAFDVVFGDAPPPAVPPAISPEVPLVEPRVPLSPTHIVEHRDSSLGSPDAGADEAMRAFFESDPDAAAAKDSKGGRFLRRK